jgi:hypothetical protein
MSQQAMSRRWILHPLLFAAYPVLFLFAANLSEGVTWSDVLLPLGFVLAAAAVAFGVLLLIIRNAQKAALLTSLYVLLFFSYGHVHDALKGVGFLGKDGFLLVLWLALATAGTVAVLRTERKLDGLTNSLTVLAAALVVLNLIPIIGDAFEGTDDKPTAAPKMDLPTASEIDPAQKRDIYYIIFDRYGNDRVLDEQFDFDNMPQLDFLESKGFYVAHDSASNHQKTAHSVASSLNMTYLNYLTKTYGLGSKEFRPINQMLQNFKVARYLQSIGYRYYHIGSWFNPTETDPSADVNYTYSALSEFSSVLLESTLWKPLSDLFGLAQSLEFGPTEKKRVDFQLEKIQTVKDDPKPTFTFMHMLLPHPPIIFDAEGNLISKEELAQHSDEENFVNQTIYANTRMREMVDGLLAGPDDEDPIVIIQSDEGPHPERLLRDETKFNWFHATDAELQEKLLILNAYYLPGDVDTDRLYQTISPVNTFRLIFDEYFGADLPLLPDRSYVYKGRNDLYNFKQVPDEKLGIDRETHNEATSCQTSRCLRSGGVLPP